MTMSSAEGQFPIVARLQGIDRGCNQGHAGADAEPACRGQDKYGDFAMREILLVLEALVGCHQNVEPIGFGCLQEISVCQIVPAEFERRYDNVASEGASEGNRCALIKENAHRPRRGSLAYRGGLQAAGGVFEDGFDLLALDSRKPGKKIIDRRAVFQVFKQRGHGDTCSPEDPGATHLARIVLHRGT